MGLKTSPSESKRDSNISRSNWRLAAFGLSKTKSSAYTMILIGEDPIMQPILDFTIDFNISLIQRLKTRGEIIDPCLTPLFKFQRADSAWPYLTTTDCLVQISWGHNIIDTGILSLLTLSIRIEWQTVSYALVISKKLLYTLDPRRIAYIFHKFCSS